MYKISKLLKFLIKLIKLLLGVTKEGSKEDYSSILNTIFIWLIGTLIFLLAAPQTYNPITWLVIIIFGLILSNLSEVLEFIKETK